MDLLSGDTTDMIDANPQAKFTTVLVTVATGRVGKVIVRKLLLRGYGVRALIRRESDKELLPPNVQVFVGDVSDLNTMREAVKGCSKIMYCARASSTFLAFKTRAQRCRTTSTRWLPDEPANPSSRR